MSAAETAAAAVAHPPQPAPGPARRALVIDDDDVILLSCRRILAKAGWEVETFDRGPAGLARLATSHPQVLVVDLKMPELDGLQVIERVRALDKDIVIVVITGYATVATAVEAFKAGAWDFLPKPFTPEELRVVAARAHERWHLAVESERLRREKADAERRFVTFVSHQLKSPIVAAKQYVDVLLHTQRAGLPPQACEWMDRTQARLGEALEIIHDWLALAKVEQGQIVGRDKACDLREVLARALEPLKLQAQTAGLTLEVRVDEGLPAVRGDAAALSTLATNLVHNAIKYNRPEGRIDVRAERDGAFLRLSVADTGHGIPEECLPRLFNEFFRVCTPENRGIPGTGLGLAICRRIATELEGTLEVASRRGEGSTFTARLPFAPPGS